MTAIWYGSYIYPLRFFGDNLVEAKAEEATELIKNITVGNHDVHISRGGGLFVERQPGLGYDDIHVFNEDVARALNQIICELTLTSAVVTDPVSPVHLGRSRVEDGHANIRGALGGREFYQERSLSPTFLLYRPNWNIYWHQESLSAISSIETLPLTTRILTVSTTAPGFVAAAYASYSRAQMAESVVDAFVVIEQIVNHYCQQPYPNLTEIQRGQIQSNRVVDRIDGLKSVGCIDKNQSDNFQNARKHRNAVAHSAVVGPDSAEETMIALHVALEFVCGAPVAKPETGRSVNPDK